MGGGVKYITPGLGDHRGKGEKDILEDAREWNMPYNTGWQPGENESDLGTREIHGCYLEENNLCRFELSQGVCM